MRGLLFDKTRGYKAVFVDFSFVDLSHNPQIQ